jgi:putative CocE/NonD family hydrolase
MLLIGGWHDPHLGGVLDLWRRARAAGGRPGLVIGAWTHLDWGGGVDEELLAFFRRHLQAPASAVGAPEGPLRLQCGSTGVWHGLEGPHSLGQALPVTAAWSLHSNGLAAVNSDEGELRPSPTQPPASPGTVVLVHDPWRPVPGRGGHLGTDAGPVDRVDLDRRSDVACFTTPPLEDPLELRGLFLLELRVRADQPSFDLCGAISAVGADGRQVLQLCTGVARFGPEAVPSDAIRSLRFQPMAARLTPGERLRLSLAGAAWPQIAVNPGDGRRPRGGSGPGHRVITLSLELEGGLLRLEPLLPTSAGLAPMLRAN